MQYTDNQIATYLFCAKLPNAKTPPLTILEWNELIRVLKQQTLEPKHLLTMSQNDIRQLFDTNKKMLKTMQKIEDRQQLGFSMIELEELTNQGYKLMFRQNMPKRLKQKLAPNHLPPFFYFVGDATIFTYPAFGVVGSRDASEEELAHTAFVGSQAAKKGVVIVSGGARGIDDTAVSSCLKNGGKAIVFPSDGLQSWVKKKEIRQYIQNNQLLVVSAQPINSRFTGYYAMQRNKYIHTASHMVLVASSTIFAKGKQTYSGTWAGVDENIQHHWTPLLAHGNSEGVRKLLTNELAQPFDDFASLLNMFSPSEAQEVLSPTEQSHESLLKQPFMQLLQSAQEAGLQPKQIRQELESLMEVYLENEKPTRLSVVMDGSNVKYDVE